MGDFNLWKDCADRPGRKCGMNKQTKELLTILLNSPGQHFTYETLADHLHVGIRMIRNYAQTIREFMEHRDQGKLLSVMDKGLCLSGSPKELKELQEALVDQKFYSYRLSPRERSGIILLMLLVSDEYCNINQFAEKLKVSRGTVLKDMEQVKTFLDYHGAGLSPMTNRGYLLEIQEKERRRLIVKIAQGFAEIRSPHTGHMNIYESFLMNECRMDQYMPVISELLLKTEQRYHMNVSDACFEMIRLTLAVIVMRIKNGRMIKEANFDIPLVRGFIVYEMAEFLLSRMQAAFHFTYTEREVGFLAHELYAGRFYSDETIGNIGDMQLHMAVSRFLIEISDDLKIPLYKDRRMAEQLENHLKDIAKAHSDGISFENEYKEPIQKEYPIYYEAVKKKVWILEDSVGYIYSEDDITFILFHVAAAAERYFQEHQKPQVIVVCHAGIGTANFLAEQMVNHFNVQIMEVTSRHKLDEALRRNDFDLIVSTVVLDLKDGLWVKVSPMLGDEDVLVLQRLFINIKREKRHSQSTKREENENQKNDLPVSILKEESIRLDVECEDWRQAIRAAAEPLLEERAIKPVYVEKMIESILKNGTYFVYCPGVALAHAGPLDGVLHFGVSLARLKIPVCFGHELHDPVSYILCMASAEKDEKLQEVLEIMNLLSKPDIIAMLDVKSRPSEILELIKEKRMEEHYGSE